MQKYNFNFVTVEVRKPMNHISVLHKLKRVSSNCEPQFISRYIYLTNDFSLFVTKILPSKHLNK